MITKSLYESTKGMTSIKDTNLSSPPSRLLPSIRLLRTPLRLQVFLVCTWIIFQMTLDFLCFQSGMEILMQMESPCYTTTDVLSEHGMT